MSSRVYFRRAGIFLPAVAFLSLMLLGSLRPPSAVAQLPATNATHFFTQVSDRLLRASTTEWLAADYANYTNTFRIDQPFGVTGIPVYVNGQMAYTPAVQRILQVAANLWDAKTNRQDAFGPLPTVFAPRFTVSNNAVFISGYVEVVTTNDLSCLPPLDLTQIPSNNLASVVQADSLIYGVPLVIGARKGLPNFNEFAMDARFTVKRYLELVKSGPGGQSAITQTNQLYTVNVSVECGAEFWNSYRTNYTRPVDIVVNNRLIISLVDSNYPSSTPISLIVPSTGYTNTALFPWPAWSGIEGDSSFLVPFRTNIALFIPQTTGYWPGSGNYVNINVTTPPYEVDNRLLIPNWSLEITNRVQAAITDPATGRILDYVILGDMTYRTNLLSLFNQTATSRGFLGVWATNALGAQISGRLGVVQQILISGGNAFTFNTAPSDWEYNYGTFPANRVYEIAKFGAFFLPPGYALTFTDPVTGEFASAINSSNRAYAPFTPSVAFTIPLSWQANDPLVHYLGRDMLDLTISGNPFYIKPTGGFPTNAMQNIGLKNNRYVPWAIDPGAIVVDKDAFNPALKDPRVRGSDDWLFPANECTTLAQLGQIHRGTPWQTIYLKSSNLGLTKQASSPAAWGQGDFRTTAQKWANWTGNRNWAEGYYTLPVRDWSLVATIASLLNTNTPQQLLSINNPDPNAWFDVLDGLSVMTNVLTGYLLQFNSITVTSNSPQAESVVASIFATRAGQGGGVFRDIGELLAAPALSLASPWLNQSSSAQLQRGLTDEAYECLPAQLLSLVRADSVGAISLGAGAGQIQFTGFDGYAYAVERSTNLVNWTVVSTNYPTNGVFRFTDATGASEKSFYRSALLP